ncbi:hypothetical protein [Demequina aurantiaca]|uniref:hypothetical protein n=1 Tax=Demequina aurantiaca TaxID=676200 RepID=UPI003D3266E2
MTAKNAITGIAVAGLAVTMLAGCGGSDDSADDTTASSVATESTSDSADATEPATEAGDSDVDDNIAAAEVLGGGSLPDEWPADLPIPDGRVLIASWQELGGTSLGQATFYVTDEAAQQAYLDQLSAAGFEVTKSDESLQSEGGVLYDASSGDWLMTVALQEIDGEPVVMLVNVFPA